MTIKVTVSQVSSPIGDEAKQNYNQSTEIIVENDIIETEEIELYEFLPSAFSDDYNTSNPITSSNIVNNFVGFISKLKNSAENNILPSELDNLPNYKEFYFSTLVLGSDLLIDSDYTFNVTSSETDISIIEDSNLTQQQIIDADANSQSLNISGVLYGDSVVVGDTVTININNKTIATSVYEREVTASNNINNLELNFKFSISILGSDLLIDPNYTSSVTTTSSLNATIVFDNNLSTQQIITADTNNESLDISGVVSGTNIAIGDIVTIVINSKNITGSVFETPVLITNTITNTEFNIPQNITTYLDLDTSSTVTAIKSLYDIDNTTLDLIPELIAGSGTQQKLILLLKALGFTADIEINPNGTGTNCDFSVVMSIGVNGLPLLYTNNGTTVEDDVQLLFDSTFSMCMTLVDVRWVQSFINQIDDITSPLQINLEQLLSDVVTVVADSNDDVLIESIEYITNTTVHPITSSFTNEFEHSYIDASDEAQSVVNNVIDYSIQSAVQENINAITLSINNTINNIINEENILTGTGFVVSEGFIVKALTDRTSYLVTDPSLDINTQDNFSYIVT